MNTEGQIAAGAGVYLDGESARAHPVHVTLTKEALLLVEARDAGREVAVWPLATLRRIDAHGAHLRLAPDHESDARLTIREMPLAAAIRTVAPALGARAPRNAKLQRKLAVWVSAAVGSVVLIVFVIAPMLADQLAEALPPEREVALGDRLAETIAEEGVALLGISAGWCRAPEGRAALEKMTERLVQVADAHVPIRVEVLGSAAPNAFALPGGRIIILDALIRQADEPAEVAGVLAHEIGHTLARDPTRNVLRSVASGAVVSYLFGDFFGGFLLVAMVDAAVDAQYSQEAERAADRMAVRLLAASEIPIAPLAGFFRKIAQEYGDGGGYLSSHPASSERQAEIEAAARPDAPTRPILTPAEWAALQRICAD